MKHKKTTLGSIVFLLSGTTLIHAQEFSELCPNSTDGTGAVLGFVSDLDMQMALPGATVRVTWDKDGEEARAETQTGIDGSFTLCYLPLETSLSIQPMLGTMTGQTVTMNLADLITQQDLGFSLAGASPSSSEDAEDDRIWACIGRADSGMMLQLGGLIRCDPQWQPLEQCPREELGRVTANIEGYAARRGALRQMVDTLIDEARRLGANALIDFDAGRGSVNAQAVKIEVDPRTC